ncbi:tumor protein p53-inducible nuclear protein 2-like [Ornithodoros turicata]
MFSGLASYFLAAEPESACLDDVTYQTLEAEDDWLLVEVSGTSKRPPSPLPEEAHMIRDLAPVFVGVMETSQEYSRCELTPPASPCPMDGSWFVTPPPCFMAQQPVHLETSPLENLLIEHPSMSVYGPCVRSHAPTVRHTPKRSRESKILLASTVEAAPKQPTSPAVLSCNAADMLRAKLPHPGPRPSAVAARAGWLEQLHGVRPTQRARACREQHNLGHNQIQRQNRVMQEGNRHPKRRDRMAARCSRVNNNRKCC